MEYDIKVLVGNFNNATLNAFSKLLKTKEISRQNMLLRREHSRNPDGNAITIWMGQSDCRKLNCGIG